jgi:hypothetical protein
VRLGRSERSSASPSVRFFIFTIYTLYMNCFRRKLHDSNGAWAMCRYIEATETSDAAGRKEIMSQILAYNEEDLEATWAVLDWVRPSDAATPVP